MSGKVLSSKVKIDGYTISHMDRENKRGGGVTLYVTYALQGCLNSKIRTDIKTLSLWVNIKDGSQTLAMRLMYRPPNTIDEINSLLWQEINRAASYSQVCVVSDFNYKNVDGNLMISNRRTDEFLKLIQNDFSTQVTYKGE